MKTAVVTGGGSGIGRAVVDRLRADGHHVATIDLNPSDDEFAQTADVTDRAQVEAALSAIRAQLGPVTILVNAAGLDGFKRFTDITFDEWQKVVDVNLNGVFHCIQAVLPNMVDAGWGRIVNISSSSTHSGTPYMSHYVAAKSAVNGLTKSLALEYGPAGITVNAVPPGFIDTPMLRNAQARGRIRDVQATIDATPVRRMGRPEDIAAACAFLISEEAGYITGQIISMDRPLWGWRRGHSKITVGLKTSCRLGSLLTCSGRHAMLRRRSTYEWCVTDDGCEARNAMSNRTAAPWRGRRWCSTGARRRRPAASGLRRSRLCDRHPRTTRSCRMWEAMKRVGADRLRDIRTNRVSASTTMASK